MVKLHISHCACTERSYVYFRSKIWRHPRVPWPRFPIWREIFGDLWTFKADIKIKNSELDQYCNRPPKQLVNMREFHRFGYK